MNSARPQPILLPERGKRSHPSLACLRQIVGRTSAATAHPALLIPFCFCALLLLVAFGAHLGASHDHQAGAKYLGAIFIDPDCFAVHCLHRGLLGLIRTSPSSWIHLDSLCTPAVRGYQPYRSCGRQGRALQPTGLCHTFGVGHGVVRLSSGVRDPVHSHELVDGAVSGWIGRRQGVGCLWCAAGSENSYGYAGSRKRPRADEQAQGCCLHVE